MNAKRDDYINNHSIHLRTSKYIGCPVCGSKLYLGYIKGEKCPLCGMDLRASSTIEKIKWYDRKAKEIAAKYKTKYWLAKIEFSGGGGNTDKYAERYATEHNYHLIVFPAQWDEFGKKAGFIRNEQMHRYIASKQDRGVIAFWDGESKETFQSFDLSKKYNNQIRVIKYKNNEK